MKRGFWLVAGVGLAASMLVAARWSLREAGPAMPLALARQAAAAPLAQRPEPDGPDPAPAAVSAQDALLRRVDLPFGEPTSLADVQKYLAETLGLAVVLDVAAMDRLDVDPEDTVQLNLKGARLKTGLKLLLDQLDMTYRVEPEDNLLILTDATQAGEPVERALREIKSLHDEMHDLQDAVDDLRDLVEEDLGIEDDAEPASRLFVRQPDRPHTPRSARAGRRQRREREAAPPARPAQVRPAAGPAR